MCMDAVALMYTYMRIYMVGGIFTGAVKITPAHDANDYEVGVRHNLPFLTIIDDDGNICGDAGEFVGMKRSACSSI